MTESPGIRCPSSFVWVGFVIALSSGCTAQPHANHASSTSIPPSRLERIDEVAMQHGFEPIRAMRFDEDQAEIRVWHYGFWPTGIILQLDGKTGRMSYVRGWPEVFEVGATFRDQQMPRLACDWSSLFARLENLGIYELPDEADIQFDRGELKYITVDGYSLIFEVANEHHNRVYQYWNPTLEPPHPALLPYMQKIMLILQVLESEFDTTWHVTPRFFPQMIEQQQVLLASWSHSITLFRFTDLSFSVSEDSVKVGHIEIEYQIRYLNDEKSELSDQSFDHGRYRFEWKQSDGPMIPELSLQLGPIMVRTWPTSDGKLRLRYPDSRPMTPVLWGHASFAITDEFSFDEVDVLDPRWEFKTAFNEYEPPCDDPERIGD